MAAEAGAWECPAADGPLVQVAPETYLEFEGIAQNLQDGVTGLNGAETSVVSPDGRQVYIASILDNAVTVFQRDVEGRLTFAATFRDGVGGMTGLRNAHSLAISGDGNFLYVSARRDNALTVLARDSATGLLTHVQTVRDNVGGVDGLRYPGVVTLSPDSRHVYITGRYDNSVSLFDRDATTGQVAYVTRWMDGVGGIDGVGYPRGVAVSADGQNVYVSTITGDGLSVFARDTTSGLLTYLEAKKNGVGGVKGLSGSVAEVKVSPDGNSVFTAGTNNHTLGVFRRDIATGRLTFQQAFTQGSAGVDGIKGAISVSVSPDGRMLAVAGYTSAAVAEFARDPSTGEITYVRALKNGANGVSGLTGVHGVTHSPDGLNVYASSFDNDAVVTFDVESSASLRGEAESTVRTGTRAGVLEDAALLAWLRDAVTTPSVETPSDSLGVAVRKPRGWR